MSYSCIWKYGLLPSIIWLFTVDLPNLERIIFDDSHALSGESRDKYEINSDYTCEGDYDDSDSDYSFDSFDTYDMYEDGYPKCRKITINGYDSYDNILIMRSIFNMNNGWIIH